MFRPYHQAIILMAAILPWAWPLAAGQLQDEAGFMAPLAPTGPEPFSFWIIEHGLGTGPMVPEEDRDDDGASNLEEYFRGTDPVNPLSKESLAWAVLQQGAVEITLRRSKTSQSTQWRLFASPDLSSPDWQVLTPEQMEVAVEDSEAFEDTIILVDMADNPSMFYRFELTETSAAPADYNFADWNPAGDGVTDDGPKFKQFFTAIKNGGGGAARIPPGTYYIEVGATNQAPIPSHVKIDASGAEFRFSQSVPQHTIFTWLYDTDVRNFIWQGGRFVGHAFDLSLNPHTLNTWHPQAHVRCFHIRTSSGGHTANILFDGVETDGIQGTAITVAGKWLDYYTVDTYATNVTLRNCRFHRTGPFLWDYGYLWQRLVWAEDYDENNRSLATNYFDPSIPRALVTNAVGTRVEFDNSAAKFPWQGSTNTPYYVWFYGTKVDSSLVRGAVYNVMESDSNHVSVFPRTGGNPVVLTGDGEDMMIMTDLTRAFYVMLHPYPPVSGEAAHGAYMVSAALGVTALDCDISDGNGDAMLIHTSRDVLISGHTILGARMGAVWVGDICDNVVVRHNYVDGGNGSRVLSVEKSSRNVLVADNTFTNGGRGSWINMPRGILISNNVFIANNGKNTRDPYLGSRSWQNGDYDNYEQMYFTTHDIAPYAGQPWGPITIVSNLMDTGANRVPTDMIHIHAGARDVFIGGNVFKGDSKDFFLNYTLENVTFGYNAGILTTNWGHFDEIVGVTTSSIRVPHELADNSFYLSAIPTVTSGNAESAMASVSATGTDIVANLQTAAPPGTRIVFDWTAYLKWK